jgi:hypothetical protein
VAARRKADNDAFDYIDARRAIAIAAVALIGFPEPHVGIRPRTTLRPEDGIIVACRNVHDSR